jgi:cytoskeletal protein CcmA (bactofilin family)
MLNKPGLFGQNDRYRRDSRGLEPAAPASAESARSDAAPEPPRPEAPPRPEVSKAEAPRSKEEQKGSRLTVGPDIKLKGAEITDCDTLVVEGRVEASMDARVMQISESGSFHGTVGVDIAEVRGRFEGEMTARKQLIIHPGGKVAGKIHYGKIVIEEGGELSGDVGTLAGVKPAAVLAAPKPAIQAANH